MFSKNYRFFLYFLIKIILFSLKIYLFAPKIAFKTIFYNETCKEFRKNQFFSNIFTFLSVIRQKFRGQLKNFSQFWEIFTSKLKNLWISPIRFQITTGFFFLINIILFTLKIYSFSPKIAFKAFFRTKEAKSFVKIYFLVTFLHF